MKIKKDIYFEDIKHFINKKFIDLGWAIVYSNKNIFPEIDQGAVYSAFINKNKKNDILNDYSWEIHIGEGMPTYSADFYNEEKKIKYYRFFPTDIEPLVYYREFYGIKENYIEISEEFRLFFNLYEDITDIHNKKYVFIDLNGDIDDVIVITNDCVKVKVKYLKEYLSIRDLSFIIYFSFDRFFEKTIKEMKINKIEKSEKEKNLVYKHVICDMNDFVSENNKTQSWISGKVIIEGLNNFIGLEKKKYCKFIIDIDENGENILYTCDENKLSNYFDKNPNYPHYLTPVYFKKEVLNKYYNNPEKYSVEDGEIKCGSMWSLKIDNDNSNYIVVFLGNLGRYLHYKEQLYWKSFNIEPKGKISRTAWKRGFKAEFTDPEQPDLYFKKKYEDFREKWYKKFGWHLFKPLNKDDIHYYNSLHIPTTNNQKEFEEQILALTKIIIDSLNDKRLYNKNKNKDVKSIDKLKAFLLYNSLPVEPIIEFLRNLQEIRSKLVAHRKSKKEPSKLQKAKEYFQFDKLRLENVFSDILIKSIWTINTLEHYFLK